MNLKIKRYLIGAGASFLGMVVTCILLYPQVFDHVNYGLSYFGSVKRTYIPYYLGFALTIFFVIHIARLLSNNNQQLSKVFWALAICMSGVAATSYSNHTAYIVHWGFAIALIICIIASAFWLIKQGSPKKLDYLLTFLIVVVTVVSIIPTFYNMPYLRVYIPREVLVSVCSLWLLGRAALKVTVET